MNKPAKLGRPPKADRSLVRSKRIFFKVTPDEHAELMAAADQPTVWARQQLLKIARRKARTQ